MKRNEASAIFRLVKAMADHGFGGTLPMREPVPSNSAPVTL